MSTNVSETTAKPFLKWAGGKSQLLGELRKLYPITQHHLTNYVEPFVGGGAVFFDVLNTSTITKATLNDINPNLINAYRVIQEDSEALLSALNNLQEAYLAQDPEGRETAFYARREAYNNLATAPLDGNNVQRAALFIFLNKTCFNGLHRVNSKGFFNVSHGKYKRPLICDEERIRAVAKALQSVNILLGDYRKTLDYIDSNTFLYLDPPYRPLTTSANFNAYDSTVFGDTAQQELADFIKEADAKGAKILLSNSDPKNANPDDNFFDDLYSELKVQRVSARRAISSKGTGRGAISEILVTNY